VAELFVCRFDLRKLIGRNYVSFIFQKLFNILVTIRYSPTISGNCSLLFGVSRAHEKPIPQ
jgi:hypothetical protein